MEEAAEESNKETDSITEVEFEIFSLNQNTADFLTKKLGSWLDRRRSQFTL